MAADVNDGQVQLGALTLCTTSPPDGPTTVGLRPEHLERDAQGALDGTVRVFEHLGGESFVHLELADGQTLVARLDGETGFAPGEALRLGISAGKCHVFDNAGQRARTESS